MADYSPYTPSWVILNSYRYAIVIPGWAQDGYSSAQIARRIGVPQAQVANAIAALRSEGWT